MDLKCPYCPEVRPTRSRLATHLETVHGLSHWAASGKVDVARTVEDVDITNDALVDSTPDEVSPDTEPTTKADRADLKTRLSLNSEQLAKAGQQMSAMRAAIESVDAQVRAMDAQLTSPATVRRATLNQVWDRLVDAGHMSAAAVVHKMINSVVDDA